MKNQRYTEAFRDGMRAAGDHFTVRRMTRVKALAIAQAFPVGEGDAFLAGYYAELRRLNAAAESEREDLDPAADRGDWQFHMGHDQ